MKTKLMVVLVALSCVGCDQGDPINKWEIVQGEDGKYGYADWDGTIHGGFPTCEEAVAQRDYWKKWSDEYDSKQHKLPVWKKADCQ